MFTLSVVAFAQTAELDSLTAKRNEAVARIDATYKAELAKLKVKYLEAKNLEGANAAAKLAGDPAVESTAAKPVGIVGTWKRTRDGKLFIFEDEKTGHTIGSQFTIRSLGKDRYLLKAESWSDTITLMPDGSIAGVDANKNPYRLERVK